MRIRVEGCCGGHERYYYRFTVLSPGWAQGKREFVRGIRWTRKIASEALDIFENCYHMSRSSIRFVWS